jgi:two-component system sensor histidine kinase KdpD
MGSRSNRGAPFVRRSAEELAIVVHELRSPVAALVAIAEALSRSPRVVPSRVELTRLALEACRGIERLVLDASIATLHRERLDVDRVVADSVAAARLAGAAVRVRIEPGLPLVDADRTRLRQALDNLLENAVAHSPEGAAVAVEVRHVGNAVAISVADAGSGVPFEEQERIFELGVRLDHERRGSGIGLAVSRAVAEAHGGSLVVESSPPAGARFVLALPALAD